MSTSVERVALFVYRVKRNSTLTRIMVGEEKLK